MDLVFTASEVEVCPGMCCVLSALVLRGEHGSLGLVSRAWLSEGSLPEQLPQMFGFGLD